MFHQKWEIRFQFYCQPGFGCSWLYRHVTVMISTPSFCLCIGRSVTVWMVSTAGTGIARHSCPGFLTLFCRKEWRRERIPTGKSAHRSRPGWFNLTGHGLVEPHRSWPGWTSQVTAWLNLTGHDLVEHHRSWPGWTSQVMAWLNITGHGLVEHHRSWLGWLWWCLNRCDGT